MKIKMLNKLPYYIIINKKKYFINIDFRFMISFEMKLQDIDDKDKETLSFKILKSWCPLFFKEKHTSEEFKELGNKFIWFYKCGRENYHKTSGSGVAESEIFSYEYDDEYLYSAFLGQYGIDLTEIDKLHWWKYKALLKGLKSDNMLEKIKSYRAYRGTDREQLSLKEYWSLPLPNYLQDELDKTAKMLMNCNK